MDSDGESQATRDDLIVEKPCAQALMKRTRPWNRVVDLPRKHESEYALFGRRCQNALLGRILRHSLTAV